MRKSTNPVEKLSFTTASQTVVLCIPTLLSICVWEWLYRMVCTCASVNGRLLISKCRFFTKKTSTTSQRMWKFNAKLLKVWIVLRITSWFQNNLESDYNSVAKQIYTQIFSLTEKPWMKWKKKLSLLRQTHPSFNIVHSLAGARSNEREIRARMNANGVRVYWKFEKEKRWMERINWNPIDCCQFQLMRKMFTNLAEASSRTRWMRRWIFEPTR